MLQSKQVVITEPGRAALQELSVDETAWSLEEVWIRTRYSLISAGTEGAAFVDATGEHRYPVRPGYAAVGEVIHEGSEFPDVHLGDLVFTYGGHQLYSRVRRVCVKAPSAVEEPCVPFARLATVAMTALRVSNLELGDWAAVIGQGTVGNLCAQLLQLAGVETVGVDLAPHRLDLAQECGIRHTVNAGAGDAAVLEQVMALTAGRGVEATVEAVGNPRTIHLAARITGRLGEVILLGSPRGRYEADVTEVFNYVHLWSNGCLTFKGAHEWRYPVQAGGDGRKGDTSPKHSLERNTHIAFRLMADDRLKVRPLRSHLLPPEQAQTAYVGLRDRKDDYVGVVFDWTQV
ncbi:MAG: zinc-binding alcohol dehydrogenase [Chloroflexi bacterium]|nr:zinc-binding alcohol dehydrogenase [Chloroflexota bacterium]